MCALQGMKLGDSCSPLPLYKSPLSIDVILRLSRLVVVQPEVLRVLVAGCTQRQLHNSLVVAQGLVLAAHRGEVQVVGHLAVALQGRGAGLGSGQGGGVMIIAIYFE